MLLFGYAEGVPETSKAQDASPMSPEINPRDPAQSEIDRETLGARREHLIQVETPCNVLRNLKTLNVFSDSKFAMTMG